MAEPIKIVQNDTYPDIDVTVIDELTQDAISLVGATVNLYIKPESGSTVTTIAGSLPNTGSDGLVRFVIPSVGNPFATSGYHEGEVEITFSGGQVQTIFEKLRFNVREEIS